MPLVQGRKRRAQPEEDESVESSPEPATQRRRTTQQQPDDDDTVYGNDNGTGDGDSNQDQMVKKLVRLALACEYQRKPIRRPEISEKVLGTAGRQFKQVFAQAQLQLRSVFGMEMVELPAREKVTVAQKRAAKSQSQASKSTSSYILISVLPPQFHTPEILQPPAVPTQLEESKYISIYTLLISLVMLSGGQLQDTKLERYLRRVQLEDNTPVTGYHKTELLLKRMEREGYIVKIRESTGTGEEDVYWVVGPRGKVEVGEDGVKGLTRGVYGRLGENEEIELERRLKRSLGVGERVAAVAPRGQAEAGEGKKKKGRKRKGAEEEQEEEEEDDEE